MEGYTQKVHCAGSLLLINCILEISALSKREWASIVEDVNRGYKYFMLCDVLDLKDSQNAEFYKIEGFYAYGSAELEVCRRVCAEVAKRLQPTPNITEVTDQELAESDTFRGLEWEDINLKLEGWYGRGAEANTSGKDFRDVKEHLDALENFVALDSFADFKVIIELWIGKLSKAMESMEAQPQQESFPLSISALYSF